MKVKSESEVTQSCPTLPDPMDCSLPGSSINGIFQARVLEWGAIAFSKYVRLLGSFCIIPSRCYLIIVSESFVTPWTVACQVPLSMRFTWQEYWNELPFPSSGDLSDSGIELFSAYEIYLSNTLAE